MSEGNKGKINIMAIDSMGFIQLIQFIEEEFNIKVNDEEMILENFETINSNAHFIKEKQPA